MYEGEANSLYQELIKQLKFENEFLRAKIYSLEAKLAQYENANAPPSLKRGSNRKRERNEGELGKPDQKIVHIGVTRPHAKPHRQVEVTADRCSDYAAELGDPFRTESKIIQCSVTQVLN